MRLSSEFVLQRQRLLERHLLPEAATSQRGKSARAKAKTTQERRKRRSGRFVGGRVGGGGAQRRFLGKALQGKKFTDREEKSAFFKVRGA